MRRCMRGRKGCGYDVEWERLLGMLREVALDCGIVSGKSEDERAKFGSESEGLTKSRLERMSAGAESSRFC